MDKEKPMAISPPSASLSFGLRPAKGPENWSVVLKQMGAAQQITDRFLAYKYSQKNSGTKKKKKSLESMFLNCFKLIDSRWDLCFSHTEDISLNVQRTKWIQSRFRGLTKKGQAIVLSLELL